MMMPANFTAVNSEVVYGGADLFSILADTTATVWGKSNVKQFNTNLLTILSNTFTQPLVKSTLGVMFGGNWGKDNDQIFGDDGALAKNIFTTYDKDNHVVVSSDDMTFGNKVMRTLGAAAAVYTLGTTPVKNVISEKVIKIDGTTL